MVYISSCYVLDLRGFRGEDLEADAAAVVEGVGGARGGDVEGLFRKKHACHRLPQLLHASLRQQP